MNNFLSCDWGTSSFRLRVIDVADFSVAAEEKNDTGIFNCYTLWTQTGKNDNDARLLFYRKILIENIRMLELTLDQSLNGTPLIISGMASSSIGMMPLPYKEMPFAVDGDGLICKHLARDDQFDHDIFLISGVQSDEDVMRGEETQLIGCASDLEPDQNEKVFILPGTHSKHIVVKDNQAVAFKTYMTGEFFELLSVKSILNATVEKTNDLQTTACMDSFSKGVGDSVESNLLHKCFKVRTNNLFNKLTKKENYNYLSGLIIGTEISDLLYSGSIQIYLCAGSGLLDYYDTALRVLGLHDNVHTYPAQWVEGAVVRGQYKIFKKQVKNE